MSSTRRNTPPLSPHGDRELCHSPRFAGSGTDAASRASTSPHSSAKVRVFHGALSSTAVARQFLLPVAGIVTTRVYEETSTGLLLTYAIPEREEIG